MSLWGQHSKKMDRHRAAVEAELGPLHWQQDLDGAEIVHVSWRADYVKSAAFEGRYIAPAAAAVKRSLARKGAKPVAACFRQGKDPEEGDVQAIFVAYR